MQSLHFHLCFLPRNPHRIVFVDSQNIHRALFFFHNTAHYIVKNDIIHHFRFIEWSESTHLPTDYVLIALFTGHRKLDDLTVYHAGARFYAPQLGLFLQPDEIDGPNRYGYVGGSPILFHDPDGYQAENPTRPFPALPCDTSSYMCDSWDQRKPLLLTSKSSHKEWYSEKKFNEIAYDPDVAYIADQFLSRNPYDPVEEKMQFISYLARDIYQSSSYSDAYYQVYTKIDALKKYTEGCTPDECASLKINELQKERQDYDRARSILTLDERLTCDIAICGDFAMFTSIALSRAGILNSIVEAHHYERDFHHGFVVFENEGALSVVDTTWKGYIKPFQQDFEERYRYEYSLLFPYGKFDDELMGSLPR